MITNSVLSNKQVKVLKAYYRGSNKQFAEGTAGGTQARIGLKRVLADQLNEIYLDY
jgi:ABC-type uncharacterized transport system YnjBCD ATPase subunit